MEENKHHNCLSKSDVKKLQADIDVLNEIMDRSLPFTPEDEVLFNNTVGKIRNKLLPRVKVEPIPVDIPRNKNTVTHASLLDRFLVSIGLKKKNSNIKF